MTSLSLLAEAPSQTSIEFSKACTDNGNSQYKSSTIETSTFHLYINDYIQIYWPYSENWDGTTAPVFVYAPENIHSLSGTGYVVGGSKGSIRTVSVNEEYCRTHPVWIINESEIPYSNLPNFAKGETISKDGVYYAQRITIPIDTFNFEIQEPQTLI